MSHIHLQDRSSITNTIADSIVEKYSTYTTTQSKISLYGVSNRPSKASITDRVVSSALRPLYEKCLEPRYADQETALNCKECKGQFLKIIEKCELEISLKVMEVFRKKNTPSSCEHVTYDIESKALKAYLRASSSIGTQSAVLPPPIYLGSYDNVQEVCQRQFAITKSISIKPLLATWHLYNCCAAVGFDTINKIGFLFHIDADSDIKKACKDLTNTFAKSNAKHFFEYVLIGGVDSFYQQSYELHDQIESIFKSNATDQISFKRKDYKNLYDLSGFEASTDSFGSRSVRLCRSVLLDTRVEDPLSNLMGYEALLNPNSAYHKYSHTIEEAENVLSNLSTEMKCVYKGLDEKMKSS